MALEKSQRSLRAWTKQDWGTKSGKKSSETGERYLPKAARDALTPAEYAATTAKKRKDTAAGKQVSKQPEKIAKKTRSARQFRSVGGQIKLQVLGGLAEDAQDKIGEALYPVYKTGARILDFDEDAQDKVYIDSKKYLLDYVTKEVVPYSTKLEQFDADEIFRHALAAYRLGDSKVKRTAFQAKDLAQANIYRNRPLIYKTEKGDAKNNKVGFFLYDKYKDTKLSEKLKEELAMNDLAEMIKARDKRLFFLSKGPTKVPDAATNKKNKELEDMGFPF